MTELTPELFRKASGYWATGVSIITSCDTDSTPYGLTMNAVTSLSLTPPLFLICVDNKSDTFEPLRRSRVFCINILSSTQQALSNAFAKKGPNKFDGVAFTRGVTNAPLLDGTLLCIECRVTDIFPGGDHQIVVGEVCNLRLPESDTIDPVLYYKGRYASVAS